MSKVIYDDKAILVTRQSTGAYVMTREGKRIISLSDGAKHIDRYYSGSIFKWVSSVYYRDMTMLYKYKSELATIQQAIEEINWRWCKWTPEKEKRD